MFKSMTTLSTISKAVLGLILSIVAATAAAEEYYTIKSKKHFPDEPGNWAYHRFSTPDLQPKSS